jgi:hypothetical protein
MTGAAADLTADMDLMEASSPAGAAYPMGGMNLMDVASSMKKAANLTGDTKATPHRTKPRPGNEVATKEAANMNADMQAPSVAIPMKPLVIATGDTVMEPADAVLLRWMRINSAK